jgi:hypothetical protein
MKFKPKDPRQRILGLIMRSSGFSATKLSKIYGFKRRTISDVLNLKTWVPEPSVGDKTPPSEEK